MTYSALLSKKRLNDLTARLSADLIIMSKDTEAFITGLGFAIGLKVEKKSSGSAINDKTRIKQTPPYPIFICKAEGFANGRLSFLMLEHFAQKIILCALASLSHENKPKDDLVNVQSVIVFNSMRKGIMK